MTVETGLVLLLKTRLLCSPAMSCVIPHDPVICEMMVGWFYVHEASAVGLYLYSSGPMRSEVA